MTKLLLELPGELLTIVFESLEREELCNLNLTSKDCRRLAAPLIWKDVDLVDCRAHTTQDGRRLVTSGPGTASHSGRGIPAGASVVSDEHDDLPMIRKLCVLATTPWLAASVETLTHRCHLAPPAIFTELPRTPFSSQTLSIDPRTIRLVRMAVQNMTRVSTLRVVFGHPKLTEALLRCFFDVKRNRETPVKRLWLESMRIVEGTEMRLERHKYGLPLELCFEGLESMRLRRLPLSTSETPQMQRVNNRSEFVYARGGTPIEVQNGLGGNYLTTINTVGSEIVRGHEQLDQALEEEESTVEKQWPLQDLMSAANRFDDAIYETLSKDVNLPSEVVMAAVPSHHWRSILAYQDRWPGPVTDLEPEGARMFRQIFRTDLPTAAECTLAMFTSAAANLTSLNIDWALTAPSPSNLTQETYVRWIQWYSDLFDLRFPHLRAFQYRNAVVTQTMLPPGLFLLDKCDIYTGTAFENRWVPGFLRSDADLSLKPLEFMEAHPKLKCLAWPMDQFFSPRPDPDLAPRVRKVVSRLGLTLEDLRVDALYGGIGELHSDDNVALSDVKYQEMRSRRRFISEFAAEMQVLQNIKVEGGVPLDERRETIRALRRCPVERLTFIGINSVIGNTWGADGADFEEGLLTEEFDTLEAEDEAAIRSLGVQPLIPTKDAFDASYGWKGRAPMIHTIMSHHGSTIRELKFCGYKGAVGLHNPTSITHPMLAALKHCHSLENLTMSFWLSTLFEGARRDEEVIGYWLDRRSSSTTSLVSLSDEVEQGSWAFELKSKYAPKALAWSIVRFIGPYLSDVAKKRGVHVRASFCVGDWGGIFDIDVDVGKGSLAGDVCLGFEGPREELEELRRKGKLEKRRWFHEY